MNIVEFLWEDYEMGATIGYFLLTESWDEKRRNAIVQEFFEDTGEPLPDTSYWIDCPERSEPNHENCLCLAHPEGKIKVDYGWTAYSMRHKEEWDAFLDKWEVWKKEIFQRFGLSDEDYHWKHTLFTLWIKQRYNIDPVKIEYHVLDQKQWDTEHYHYLWREKEGFPEE